MHIFPINGAFLAHGGRIETDSAVESLLTDTTGRVTGVCVKMPLALIFSENSMTNLQTVSIIAAFPVGIIMLIIITSFFKDADAYLKEQDQNTKS